LALPVQTVMAGHVESEMKALYALSMLIVSGASFEIEASHEYQEGSTKIIAMPIVRGANEYLFTIEETGDDMLIALRSTQIPTLFVSLPAPLMINFADSTSMEDLC